MARCTEPGICRHSTLLTGVFFVLFCFYLMRFLQWICYFFLKANKQNPIQVPFLIKQDFRPSVAFVQILVVFHVQKGWVERTGPRRTHPCELQFAFSIVGSHTWLPKTPERRWFPQLAARVFLQPSASGRLCWYLHFALNSPVAKGRKSSESMSSYNKGCVKCKLEAAPANPWSWHPFKVQKHHSPEDLVAQK